MTDVPDMLMNFPFLDDEGLSLPHWFFDPCSIQLLIVSFNDDGGGKISCPYHFLKGSSFIPSCKVTAPVKKL